MTRRKTNGTPYDQTRAFYFGIKDLKKLTRDTQAKLSRLRAKLPKIEEPYIDVDQAVTEAFADVTAAIDRLVLAVNGSDEYLSETFE